MKRLRISSLMDEYTDTEVFPTGGSAVDSGAVKERVLANIKAPARAKKKQMPRKKKMLLAAALTAVLVMLVGAGFPYIQHQLIHGKLSFEQTANGRTISFEHDGAIVEYEDGRLIFNQDDGGRIDITDLVSEETPYIYDGSDPDTGMIYYIIMGGTPKAYGWLEWIQVPYPFDDSNSDVSYAIDFDENGNPVQITYDFEVLDQEDTNRNAGGMGSGSIHLEEDFLQLPWLLAAVEELDIPTIVVPPESITTIYTP